jgi:hypothetical protein
VDENIDVKKHLPIIGIFVLIVVLVLASRKSSGGAGIASYNQALAAGAAADNELSRIEAGQTVELARIKQGAISKLLEFKLASQTVEAGERTAFMEASSAREIALNTNSLNASLEAAKLAVARDLGFQALTTQQSIETTRATSATRIEEVRAALERERAALTSGATVAQAQAQAAAAAQTAAAAAAAQTAQAQAAAAAQTAAARAQAGAQNTSTIVGAITSIGARIFDRIWGR